MANKKTYQNFYWSIRRYLWDNFVDLRDWTFYNPVTKPSVTGDKCLLVFFPDDSFRRLAQSSPRIVCVAKNDPESIKITELSSAVVEKFTSPATGLKVLNFLEYETEKILGQIRVRNVRSRIALPYSEGYVEKAVDMDMDYVVEQRHPFA